MRTSRARNVTGRRAVARARGGMANVAESAGLSRETLYRTLGRSGNPRLSTLLAVMRAVRIGIKAVASA